MMAPRVPKHAGDSVPPMCTHNLYTKLATHHTVTRSTKKVKMNYVCIQRKLQNNSTQLPKHILTEHAVININIYRGSVTTEQFIYTIKSYIVRATCFDPALGHLQAH